MAFAIIETGGKQYRVAEGDVFKVEKLTDHKAGDTVVFDKVLLIDDGETTVVGTPYLEGKTLEVTLVEEGKGKKLHIQKFKSKSRYKRRLGHRQVFAKVKASEVA
ncbi:MAG: 50S ribosomal protein L21 [Candidatus Pacebacteria bacterium]|nr:50S ribosomal protein L21 [Candidatus Paceibacterota bacterium]